MSGIVVWRGEYLPFGEVFSENTDPDGDGTEVEQPFRFPGQYEDAETGLYYNYFRDYDPALGRYTEADPIGLAGGVNLWGYVQNMPIVWIDPQGLVLCKLTLPGLGTAYLDDTIAPLVMDFLSRAEKKGIELAVSQAFRTTKQQENLKDNPAAITPAKSGTSLHEAGFAIDIHWSRISEKNRDTVVALAKAADLDWGGKFKKPDPVHFYKEVPGGINNRGEYIDAAQKLYLKGVNDCETSKCK